MKLDGRRSLLRLGRAVQRAVLVALVAALAACLREDTAVPEHSPPPFTPGADAGVAHAVCTPGADQTCNDNPTISSLHGRCTDAGTCECAAFPRNPNTGRCR